MGADALWHVGCCLNLKRIAGEFKCKANIQTYTTSALPMVAGPWKPNWLRNGMLWLRSPMRWAVQLRALPFISAPPMRHGWIRLLSKYASVPTLACKLAISE